MYGLDWYDFGARMYDPLLYRWMTMDPLCEKYYDISPYVYCNNDPINIFDPNGKEIIISGSMTNNILDQLQYQIGNKVCLYLTEDNHLCYNIKRKGHINKNTQLLIQMIDNSEIVLNIETCNSKTTSKGNLFVGGAFMGNTVHFNSDNNVDYIDAFQVVNPTVLNEADKFSKKGTFIMHELSEAYEGAKISSKKKVSTSYLEKNVYKEAHNKATYQPTVFQKLYDNDGNVTLDSKKAVRVEWYVVDEFDKNKQNIIQTYP